MRDEELPAKSAALFTSRFVFCRGEVQGHDADRPLTPAELDKVERRVFQMLRALEDASTEFLDGASKCVAQAITYAKVFFATARQSEGRVTAPDEAARLH